MGRPTWAVVPKEYTQYMEHKQLYLVLLKHQII
jgi:hypothetical protein